MKITVTKYIFERAFMDAEERRGNFTYSGLCALLEHLEELEEQAGTETELDVDDICDEYAEYTSAVKAAMDYGWTKDLYSEDYPYASAADDVFEDDYDEEAKALSWLNAETTVIVHDNGVIVAKF